MQTKKRFCWTTTGHSLHFNPVETRPPYPGVPDVLNKMIQAPLSHPIIISGRWIKDLIPLLKISPQPEIWGSHGLERLKPDGSYEIAAMDENALRGIVTADEWTQEVGLSDLCEKNQVHWHCTGAD